MHAFSGLVQATCIMQGSAVLESAAASSVMAAVANRAFNCKSWVVMTETGRQQQDACCYGL
jgi:hypothetical protein